MTERISNIIEFVGKAKSNRDFCIIPTDDNLSNSLVQLANLEAMLKEDKLSREQWDKMIVSQIRFWTILTPYYKGILSDLTAIETH